MGYADHDDTSIDGTSNDGTSNDGTRMFPAFGEPHPPADEHPPAGDPYPPAGDPYPPAGDRLTWAPVRPAHRARPARAARLAEQLYRFRPDRVILASGSLVAAAAVAVAFATAGGSAVPAHSPAQRAAATTPACASPAPGR